MNVRKEYVGGAMELDLSWLAAPVSQNLRTYFGLNEGSLLLASGRCAFGAILDTIQPGQKTVLVPDFLCCDALLPRLEERGIAYRYYPVTPDLAIDEDALFAQMDENTAAVLLINYFGFCDWESLARKINARDNRIAIVLDNVQALYDRTGHAWANYAFASFRKFLSVPDGAFGCGRDRISDQPRPALTIDSCAPYIAAAVLRHRFLEGAFDKDQEDRIEETYLALFADASARVPTAAAAMSSFSQTLVDRLPLDAFASRRRENYHTLAEAFATIPKLTVPSPELPANAVPMALPVLTPKANRDGLIAHLRDCGIFCPVHWPLTDDQRRNGGDGCKELAERIISFPIDQRIGPERLKRVAEAVRTYWRQA